MFLPRWRAYAVWWQPIQLTVSGFQNITRDHESVGLGLCREKLLSYYGGYSNIRGRIQYQMVYFVLPTAKVASGSALEPQGIVRTFARLLIKSVKSTFFTRPALTLNSMYFRWMCVSLRPLSLPPSTYLFVFFFTLSSTNSKLIICPFEQCSIVWQTVDGQSIFSVSQC